MRTNTTLNLLVIDDDQLYAEGLINLLKSYYAEVNLGFLDDQEELLKSLRHSWDVLVFGRAYDLSFTDVVAIVQEHNIDLPIIGLMSDELADNGRNQDGLPVIIDGTMVKALVAERETQVVMAIRLLHANLLARRQVGSLKQVLTESEQRANLLIKNSKSAVAYIDQGIHIFANDPYLKMFNFETMDDIIGLPVIDLIAGSDNVKDFKQFLRQFDKGNRQQVEFNSNSKTKDGDVFEVKLQLATATFEGEPVTQIIIQQSGPSSAEIDKQLAAVERLDSLTGLSNRRGFEERLASLHQQVLNNKSHAGLLYIQLDNTGRISSSLGLEGVD
ncbi:MAG: diguanylate cyclase domain-containing protein, partial [Psychrobacter sp.]